MTEKVSDRQVFQVDRGRKWLVFIILPPAIADKTDDDKGGKSEVKNTGIHAFGWLFSQLLGRFCADRTLSLRTVAEE